MGPQGVIREELERQTPEPTSLSPEMFGQGRVVQNLRHQRPRGRGAGAAAGTLGTAPVSPAGHLEKRARPNEDASTWGGEPETILINEEEEKWRAGTRGEGTDAETRVLAREVPWAPEVRHYAGSMIHHVNCAATNIGTAFGLLRLTILPQDGKTVNGCTEDLTGEIAQALLVAGARAFAINNRSNAREAEIEKLKLALAQKEDDLRVARETCGLYLASFQKFDRERVLTEDRARRAEEDANTLRATRAREVEGAKKRGYDSHEALLQKLSLPEDSELRALPEALPEELVMPEEEGEQVVNPEAEIVSEDQAVSQTAIPTGDASQTPPPEHLGFFLFLAFIFGWTAPDIWSFPFQSL
ncbi:hypothetical protein RHMOL_Rhmol06G0120000 [Rhododendron molle]|uniref:Uncharacterized protein n=1 Tax=Rhododendron molle TaxID=49168 RepID=A0ACC0NBG4_RHOML|nr:hypothetical protein RHMOL_Rhmol06G0120000 [Rhododendron molle]